MQAKRGQTVYDLVLQAYGSVEDVFTLMRENPGIFTRGLSTQVTPGAEINAPGASSAPRVQALYNRAKRAPGTGDSVNATVQVTSAQVSDAYVGGNLTATVQVENTGLRPAIGDLIFDWGFKQSYAVAVFLLPGQQLTVTDTVEGVPVTMLGSHDLVIGGVANYTLNYFIKGKASYAASNALDVNTGFVLRIYDEAIQITQIASALGTASLYADAGKIKCSAPGTVYDLTVSDGANEYHFPLAEGMGDTVHDINHTERAIIAGYTWAHQDTLHHNLYKGATELDTGGGFIYVPYDNSKTKIYNDL